MFLQFFILGAGLRGSGLRPNYPHLPQTQLDFVQEVFGQAMAGPTALALPALHRNCEPG